jgi:hypothetical protein
MGFSSPDTSMTHAWQSDAFGTFVLDTGHARVWTEARPYHCDRGHWSLGMQGVFCEDGREPSLYFMELDTALREGELWLARAMGRPVVPMEEESLPPGLRLDWKVDPHATALSARTPDGVDVELTHQGDGPMAVWTLTIDGIDSLDGADGFPRHYLRLEHAAMEAEGFLRWRLDHVPAEVSGPIDLPPRPMDARIEAHLAAAPVVSRSPSP